MALNIRRPFLAAAAVAGAIALALFPRFASADRTVSERDLRGTYRGVAVEIRQDPGSPVEFCHIVGTAVADGRGNISVDNMRRCSVTGTFHDVATGTYSVDSDGTVVFALGDPDGGRGVLDERGATIVIDNYSAAPGDPVLAFHGVFVRVF